VEQSRITERTDVLFKEIQQMRVEYFRRYDGGPDGCAALLPGSATAGGGLLAIECS
jgi:hypothetical protein